MKDWTVTTERCFKVDVDALRLQFATELAEDGIDVDDDFEVVLACWINGGGYTDANDAYFFSMPMHDLDDYDLQ